MDYKFQIGDIVEYKINNEDYRIGEIYFVDKRESKYLPYFVVYKNEKDEESWEWCCHEELGFILRPSVADEGLNELAKRINNVLDYLNDWGDITNSTELILKKVLKMIDEIKNEF